MNETIINICRNTGRCMLVLFGLLVYGCIPSDILIKDPSIGETPSSGPSTNEVEADPPTIELFEANPPFAIAGQTSTLRWRTRNAVSVHLSQVGPVPANGEHTLTDPEGDYVLTATDRHGRSVSESRNIPRAHLQVIGPQSPDENVKVVESEERPTIKQPARPVIRPKRPKPSIEKVEKPLAKPSIKKPNRPAMRPSRPKPSIATAAIIQLPAPAPLSPKNGARFNKFPRRTTLRWRPVRGAARYGVEIDCYNCCKARRWCTDENKTFKKAASLSGTTYTFNFVGAQPGRWRVWAVDGKGRPGKASTWQNFSYTR